MPNSSPSTERADALIGQLLTQRTAFLRFLTAKVGPAAAEDILQSCYLKLVEKGLQLRQDESVILWFYTVLRHATVDYYRRNASRDRAHEQFAAEAPVSYEEEVKANICGCVTGVLDTLRRNIELRYKPSISMAGLSLSTPRRKGQAQTMQESDYIERAKPRRSD